MDRLRFCLWLLLFLFWGNAGLQAQENQAERKALKKQQRDSIRQHKIKAGKSIFTPIIAPGYTPEFGALIAVGGIWSFKTNPADQKIERSSIPFTAAYSTTGAVIVDARPVTFWFEDKLRISAEIWLKNLPDNYWGIGYQKATDIPKGENTTAYLRRWRWINPQFLYQFKRHYFAGLNVDINFTQGDEESEGVFNDENYQEYNDKPFNAGLGLILRHDSRDFPVNAHSGWYLDVNATAFSQKLGGDNNYEIYQLDYRYYVTLGRDGRTLAWQIKSRIGIGGIPYGEMSKLGNPFDLRGYTWGRYRDKSLFFILPEYRHMFAKSNGTVSRHGFVLWAGTGTVFDIGNTSEDVRLLPNGGFGYRLELQDRLNLRVDFGFGHDTFGFYFNFLEAF
ncbi:BamA/TamA family outer membrane protein [Persicobacter diffluens]|uniref:Bacterial surface antigen (D15) domain-containing protein n=1 Tax=Persicobacter diffluens TaxID=981 RepID=A0AAN4W0R8_9BACT|nr:hypothetical protein PEDI_30600 [Persicobacter diffluens]